ncbi:CPBP family intramembrane glutamic endopeptidase [Streptococcus uberis]|uniref:CPBP family intramembrane glutamic endopeptidase n=1 Tax=Streptococcus uberis TaxID=1349 RepID=UPI0006203D46|nr:type II CAAX endopeptidase family protein [Streptococcus uberis]AUC24317.1 CPBP family intramembrane metalloprotease domain-containing protein [Streptococcus uberis]KKF45532.1 CAAX amino protease [Streptococcus uberis Ab71]KKF61091.1 CAAX amino protease [Streptococcus uberis B362]MCK1193321.1 CPBP family intramembrane metalloprotease [Streptococcus uberis]MCK1200707.1 CPBP family intramembrane metalloprotease [Streptococcus uberis]
MQKRILEMPTKRYQKLPAWLMILLACGMVQGFMLVGGLLAGMVFLLFILFMIILRAGDTSILSHLSSMMNGLYFQLACFAFFSLTVMAWVKWYERRPLLSLGFYKDKWFFEILKGWLIGTFLFALSVGLSYLLGGLAFKGFDFSPKTLCYVIGIIPLWFIQGGTEELLTRGWLLPLIAKRSHLATAIIISSSLFGMMHLANDHVTVLSVVSIILVGIFMALYMLKTDNIWGVAGIHGAWNFTQGNLCGLAVSGQASGPSILQFDSKVGAPEWLSGGAFGTEGSLVASLVLLFGILILAWRFKREDSGKK